MVGIMVRDITYCSEDSCPYVDCIRHMRQLDGEGHVIISISNFGGVCRKYIEYIAGDLHNLHYEDVYQTA